jgi:hypothetical protein
MPNICNPSRRSGILLESMDRAMWFDSSGLATEDGSLRLLAAGLL